MNSLSSHLDWLPSTCHALVVSTSRRWATLSLDGRNTFTVEDKVLSGELCVGDIVRLEEGGATPRIAEIHPRKNILRRELGTRKKQLAANSDRLLILVDGGPLFQTLMVDRMLAAATFEGIPATLVLNKLDNGIEPAIEKSLRRYESLASVFRISAKTHAGIEALEQSLRDDQACRIAALAGPSGVGKSSLMNLLSPDANRRTSSVRSRSGQGQQTTTQSLAFYSSRLEMFLIDLPGIQSFGVTHLSHSELQESMPDIQELSAQCEFSNCSHIAEEHCAVKAAYENGELFGTRYESYCEMYAEISAYFRYE